MEDYLFMWKILEEFVQNGEVINLGISDIETDIFIQLYEAAQVCSFDNDSIFVFGITSPKYN